jgi:hypothetical protein
VVFDAMHAVVAQTLLAAGKKKRLFGPLSMPKNHQFTQTGSGQTEGTLPKRLCRVSCVTEPAFLKKWEQTAREHPGQQLHCSQHCYHLLGVDIIFDDRWHPRVIEVNGEPSMKPGNHTITLLLLRFSCCEGCEKRSFAKTCSGQCHDDCIRWWPFLLAIWCALSKSREAELTVQLAEATHDSRPGGASLWQRREQQRWICVRPHHQLGRCAGRFAPASAAARRGRRG